MSDIDVKYATKNELENEIVEWFLNAERELSIFTLRNSSRPERTDEQYEVSSTGSDQ